MKALNLIIFDWDGTLIDSVSRITACFVEAFHSFNLTPPPIRAIQDTIGLPLTEARHILLPEDSTITEQEWVEAYRQVWLDEARLPLSPLFPGVPDLLADLSRRYEMCIATGKSRVGLERELHHYGLEGYFRERRCAGETKPKPHPEMLHQLLDAYQMVPAQAVMIGDTVHDIDMAHAAGMPAVGVTSGGQTAQVVQAARPAHVFADVTGLRNLLL